MLNNKIYKKEKIVLRTIFGKIHNNSSVLLNDVKLHAITLNQWPFLIEKKNIIGVDLLHFANSVLFINQGLWFFGFANSKNVNIYYKLKKYNYIEAPLLKIKHSNYFKIYNHKGKPLKFYLYAMKIKISDKPYFMIIDTGSQYSYLNLKELKKFNGKIIKERIGYLSDLKNIKKTISSVKIEDVEIGNHKLGKILLNAIKMPYSFEIKRSKDLQIIGILGLDFLMKTYSILDFNNEKVYLIL